MILACYTQWAIGFINGAARNEMLGNYRDKRHFKCVHLKHMFAWMEVMYDLYILLDEVNLCSTKQGCVCTVIEVCRYIPALHMYF